MSSSPGVGYGVFGSNCYIYAGDDTLRVAQTHSSGYISGMWCNKGGVGNISFFGLQASVTANQDISSTVNTFLFLDENSSWFGCNILNLGNVPTGDTRFLMGYYGSSALNRNTYIDFCAVSNVADYNARIIRWAGTNGAFDITQKGSSNLTISTNEGTGALNLQGNTTSGTAVGIYEGVTQLVAFGTASYTCDVLGSLHYTSAAASSDERFKENVETLTGSLAKVKALRGVAFNWNALHREMSHSNHEREYGFIAQEAELIIPELIKRWKRDPYETEWLAINYERLIPVLVEAIKELEARVALLEA